MTGGQGWVVSRHGWACASLRAVDIVTADGEVVHADDENHPDVIWAARGGGPGLFGAVVRLYLDLHPLPASIRLSNYAYPLELADEVYHWVDSMRPQFSRDLEIFVSWPRKPHGPAADEPVAMVLNATAMSDSDAGALEALEILEQCPCVDQAFLREVAVPKTVEELFTWSDAMQPFGYYNCIDNLVTDAPVQDLIPELRAALEDIPNELSFILVVLWHHLPEVPNAVFSLHGTAHVSLSATWSEPEEEDRYVGWATRHVRRMEPLATGTYIGEAELARPARAFFSPENYARFEQVRDVYDPDRLFVPFDRLFAPSSCRRPGYSGGMTGTSR